MTIDLNGKLALVTGSSGGIGQSIALALAASGADVAVNYLSNAAQGQATAEQIERSGRRSRAFQADVSDVREAERLIAETEAYFGRSIDILINNAGHLIGRVANMEMTEEHYDKVMDVNLKSCVFVSKAAARGMVEKGGGSIVNLTSIAAHNGGGPGATLYAASKAAVIAYTKGLAKELAGKGIRVNAVSPGFIGATAFHDTFTSNEARKSTVQGIPLGREGKPDDVAGVTLFLVSDLSGYLTGETIEVNGGMYMR